ncbi:MAG: hypothetical protein JRI25_13425 [Deltaproteobacteria bacterium]|nr:hypothetical protein [Deltaproteobacteria bacterium]
MAGHATNDRGTDLQTLIDAFFSEPASERPTPAPATRVYSPWTEQSRALEERHVGREDVLELITIGIARLARGERPLPIYLFGPRGIGKSHLVALGVGRAPALLDGTSVEVRTVSEDIAAPRDADQLWEHMAPPHAMPPWLSWSHAPPHEPSPPAVVFIEGFDRHLDALGSDGRKRLRALLSDHPQVWMVATGAQLTDIFVNKEEAFFGWFDVHALPALTESEAYTLVDRQAGEDARSHSRWLARREALVTLAGGNPRALIALADAVAAAPGEEVARRLLFVLDNFTPQYQLRMRILAANEQRLVSLLTSAPRELGPTDVARVLGGVPSTWSTAAHRLVSHGVLSVRQEGRNSWYRITEPLFRYWLEYRTSPPERTRVAWLGQLLERVLGPDEIVAAWTRSEDDAVRAAALEAVRRRPDARDMAWADRVSAVQEALGAVEPHAVKARVTEAMQVGPTPAQAWSLVVHLVSSKERHAAALLAPALSRGGCPSLGSLVRGLESRVDVRGVLRNIIAGGKRELARAKAFEPEIAVASTATLTLLFDKAIARMDPRGRSWKIRPEEARALARLPGLRVRFYRHGRLRTHEPLIRREHLLRAALDPGDPDLPELLWIAMARHHHDLAARLLAILDMSEAPRLPWCPWPGRRLALDADAIARVAARWAAREAILWVGALVVASESSFEELVRRLRETRPPAPTSARSGSYELALGKLALNSPARFEALREALDDPWNPLFIRVGVLMDQMKEGERGPLHPELARIRDALLSDEAM